MKAITTRYIGQTERKAARILATDLDGNRITLQRKAISPTTTSTGLQPWRSAPRWAGLGPTR
jgi:hypothetical protein